MVKQAASDLESALHAAGERANQGIPAFSKIDELQYAVCSFSEKSGRQIVEHGVKPEVLLRGETIVERLILEYQANAAPDFVGFCCYVIARYTRFTGRRSQ